MPTKEELEESINEKMGTDHEFSRMKKDDLVELEAQIEQGALLEPLASHIAKREGKKKVEDIIEEWYPGKHLL